MLINIHECGHYERVKAEKEEKLYKRMTLIDCVNFHAYYVRLEKFGNSFLEDFFLVKLIQITPFIMSLQVVFLLTPEM